MLNRPSRNRRNSNIPFLVIFIILAFSLGLAFGYLFWGGSKTAAGDQVRRVDVSTDNDASIGPADAPITVIEFSDFQCPYCQKWYAEVFEQMMAAYPGQIRFVYRDFPLPNHAEAEPAAEAAECAGEQSAYWQFHDALFSGRYDLDRSAYDQYAAELGLDTAAFSECLDSHRYQAEVEADADDAANAGISSTPSFVINGRILVGALPFADFKAVIDEELAAKAKK